MHTSFVLSNLQQMFLCVWLFLLDYWDLQTKQYLELFHEEREYQKAQKAHQESRLQHRKTQSLRLLIREYYIQSSYINLQDFYQIQILGIQSVCRFLQAQET